jgi:hypothetical protein
MGDKSKEVTDEVVTNDDDPRFIALTAAERRDIVTNRIKQREAAMLGLWMDIVELEESSTGETDLRPQIVAMRNQAEVLAQTVKRLLDLAGGKTSL